MRRETRAPELAYRLTPIAQPPILSDTSKTPAASYDPLPAEASPKTPTSRRPGSSLK